MTGYGKSRGLLVLICFFTSIFFVMAGPPTALAQDVIVSQAIPDNAPQGMVSLNVQVKGSGFKKGAVAKWLVTGSETDTGGVTVNSTTYVSPTELRANITVAADAQTEKKYDIKVTLTSGRTGKGIELFKVLYNPPDPAIAFVVPGNETLGDSLVVMNEDGTNQRAILAAPRGISCFDPSWSPDGAQLAFSSNIQGQGIYVINKDGSGLRKVVSTNTGNYVAWSPAPTADGQFKVAFDDIPLGRQDSDLYLVNLDGTDLVNLTNSVGPGDGQATWNPYGTHLAVKHCDETCAKMAILVYELGLGTDGKIMIKNVRNLTESGPLAGPIVSFPSWGKMHDVIALNAFEGTNDIWVIDLADPGNPLNLTNTLAYDERMPSWSPDDSSIAYRRAGTRKGKTSIFTMSADGSGAKDIGQPGGNSPDWRRCCPTCATVCAP
jgi:hypothetical protein